MLDHGRSELALQLLQERRIVGSNLPDRKNSDEAFRCSGTSPRGYRFKMTVRRPELSEKLKEQSVANYAAHLKAETGYSDALDRLTASLTPDRYSTSLQYKVEQHSESSHTPAADVSQSKERKETSDSIQYTTYTSSRMLSKEERKAMSHSISKLDRGRSSKDDSGDKMLVVCSKEHSADVDIATAHASPRQGVNNVEQQQGRTEVDASRDCNSNNHSPCEKQGARMTLDVSLPRAGLSDEDVTIAASRGHSHFRNLSKPQPPKQCTTKLRLVKKVGHPNAKKTTYSKRGARPKSTPSIVIPQAFLRDPPCRTRFSSADHSHMAFKDALQRNQARGAVCKPDGYIPYSSSAKLKSSNIQWVNTVASVQLPLLADRPERNRRGAWGFRH